MLAILTRRIGFAAVLTLHTLQFSPVGVALTRWNTIWHENRVQILFLAAVNTSITVANEAVAREISTHFIDKSPQNAFLILKNESYSINRQSMVNIWMTLITSLLGGVAFFIKRKSQRFLFFCTLGLFVSVVSQCCTHLIRDGKLYIDSGRLAFDLVYLFSIKYLIFEFGRERIATAIGELGCVSGVRLLQDFVTTLLRVFALNVLGFKG